MALNITILVLLLCVGGLASLIAAFLAWRQTDVAGYRSFALALGMLALWCFMYAGELLVGPPELKLIFAKLQYLSLPLTPTILVFASATYRMTWQKSWYKVAPLFVIPLITNIFVWTRQPLIWSNVSEITVGNTMQLAFEYGPWFPVSLLTTYLLYIFAAVLIFRIVFSSPRLTRPEAGGLLMGALTPFCANLIYMLRIEALQGIDLTPLSLATFGLITAWIVFEVRPAGFLPLVYDASFQSLPDPAMTVDVNNRVRYLNPAGVEQMRSAGLDPLTVSGGPMSGVMPAHWYTRLKDAGVDAPLRVELERYVYEVTEYFDARITPLFDRRNRFRGRLFVIQDITQRKHEQLALAERGEYLEKAVKERTAELSRTNDELINAVRMKDAFLAGMSHELRTPLSAVLGTSESIRSGVYGSVPHMLGDPLKRIESSAHHLLELINDILDVSKIEAGNFELQTEPIELEGLCRTCLQVLESDARKKGIRMTFSAELKQKIIIADRRRLRQILINLLANAVKFTPDGGHVTLEVTDCDVKRVVCIDVCDTGIGISEADQERIFAPFVQVDSSLSRQYEGTGLGLALTRSLVKLHGGELTVHSTLGEGSRFTVELPWLTKDRALQ